MGNRWEFTIFALAITIVGWKKHSALPDTEKCYHPDNMQLENG